MTEMHRSTQNTIRLYTDYVEMLIGDKDELKILVNNTSTH